MWQNPHANGRTAETPVSAPPRSARQPSADQADAEGAVEGVITVQALRDGVSSGGSVLAAVATLRRDLHEPPQYRLYVRCSWTGDAFLGVAVHRARFLRAQKTFEPWVLLLDQFGYAGPVTLYRDTDPALAKLGIPGRSAP